MNSFLLYLLPAIVKPRGRPCKTIRDAQKSFLFYVDEAKNITPMKTPTIIVVGNKVNIKQIVVNLCGQNFVAQNIIQALDLSYAMFWVLDLAYPHAANNAFVFIQKIFFGTTIKDQKFSPDVDKLVKLVKNAIKA